MESDKGKNKSKINDLSCDNEELRKGIKAK